MIDTLGLNTVYIYSTISNQKSASLVKKKYGTFDDIGIYLNMAAASL